MTLTLIHSQAAPSDFEPEDAQEAAALRALDVGTTAAAIAACRHVRAAARRILRRPEELTIEQLKLYAAISALSPVMAPEAIELEAECRSAQARPHLGQDHDLRRVLMALATFLTVHRGPPATLSA